MESATAQTEANSPPRVNQTKGLLDRLHRAQKVARPVKKEGRNKAQGYDYARAEDVITEASRVLQNEGLVAAMNFTEIAEREITSKGGGSGLYVRVVAELQIIDPITEENLVISGYGTGIDYPGDKAVFKAMTGGAKYAYSSALAMPFSDDPEHDRGTEPTTSSAAADTPTISPKQMDYFASLVKKHAPTSALQEDVDRIVMFGASTFTGGRGGTMSTAIDGLKDKATAAATWRELMEAATAWVPPSDLPPPDTSDLPPAEEIPGQTTIVP